MREVDSAERKIIGIECDNERLNFIFKCISKNDSDHERTRAFVVEILNDNQAIFEVLKNPKLPLTKNRAELFLRGLVILRNMCYGSKTEEGSRTVAILASIIDTLGMRNVDPWQFLAELINFRRSGQAPPPMPSPA